MILYNRNVFLFCCNLLFVSSLYVVLTQVLSTFYSKPDKNQFLFGFV